MNNAIYRKIMENLKTRIDVKLVNNEKDEAICRTKYLTIIQWRYIKFK